MIIVFVSTIFLLIGIAQIYFSAKNSKNIKSKILSTNIIASHEDTQKNIIISNLANNAKLVLGKVRRNLIGKNSELLVKTAAITFAGVTGALYINAEFLQFGNLTIAIIVMIIIPYILYVKQEKKVELNLNVILQRH
ncbi:hypothetical protein FHC49_00345 [Kluyvera sp. EC_51]|uniref:hypothetical protein n=1 Tax=Kluyvera sp. EC_51 TaxID=2584089 RepID=UPI001C703987|nr:hypothetical protein [Kluyvera sp. EC_51]MBW9459875.1 hypothetical protein [Kluyvera sp. EC_51]